jgi:hypothetical protein
LAGLGVLGAAESSGQGIAVRSTVALFATVPTTVLPSLACHDGPAKWLMISWPLSANRFARGATKLHATPLHELIWTPTPWPTRNGLFPAPGWSPSGTAGAGGRARAAWVRNERRRDDGDEPGEQDAV